MEKYFVFATLAFITVFWLYRLFIRPIFNIFRRYRRMQQNTAQGMPTAGIVLESKYLGKVNNRGARPISIKVELANFAGAKITEDFRFFDIRPHEQRFEPGASIQLYINDRATSGKRVAIANQNYSINPKTIALYLGLLSISIYVLYSYVVYPIWLKANKDWSQLIDLFNNSTGAMLIYIYAGTMLFVWVLFTFLTKAFGGQPKTNYKYYGLSALANITKYAKTNTRINDNPVVRFDFVFTARNGQTIHGSDTKMINEFEVGRVHEMSQTEVMYLPETPEKAIFAEKALGTSSLQIDKVLWGVFRLVLFIFSVIVCVITITGM